MIQTTLDCFPRYCDLNPRFAKALSALQELAAMPFAPGRHAVDGEAVFINAVEYDTKPASASVMEAHRRYIDVMLLCSGEETIGVQPACTLREITMPYDVAGDALLAALEPGYSALHLRAGDMAILFPEDAHAPGMDYEGTHHVRKLIAKVLVAEEAK